ncbi:hypothetical protein HDV00_002337 [Rhizophlyctis rosea]|nr:hypothetical protein HDV00_002337 [Rhizophlyctis rosea]
MHLPFLKFVILDDALRPERGNGVHVGSVLSWLRGWVEISSESDALAAGIVSLFLDLLKGLPVSSEDSSGTHAALIGQTLLLVNKLDQPQRQSVLFALLGRICDLQHAQLPAATELELLRLYVLDGAFDLRNHFTAAVLSTCMAYLLLQVSDMDIERAALLDILVHVVKSAEIDVGPMNVALRLLVYPVLQTVGEAQNAKIRRRAFDIMVIFERACARDHVPDEISSDAFTQSTAAEDTTGVLRVLISHTTHLINHFHTPTMLTSAFQSSIPNITTLFLSAYTFHLNPSTRRTALTTLSTQTKQDPQTSFSLLPLLLYTLRTEPDPTTRLHLLHQTLPSLTASADPYITARVLRVILSVLGESDRPATALSVSGVRAMVELVKHQPRTWPHLKGWLAGWAKQRRFGRGVKGKKGGVEVREVELEVAATFAIRQLCETRIAEYGQDVLPIAISLLQTPDLHVSSTCYVLESINKCILANVTDPRAVWNVFMRQFASSVNESTAPAVMVKLCEYYGLVALKSDGTDVYTAFIPEILTPHLLPLTTHPNLQIRNAAYTALSHYPAPDLYPHIPLPTDLVSQILSDPSPALDVADLLGSLIRHECKHMRRAVFKGLAVSAGVKGAESRGEGQEGEEAQFKKVVRDVVEDVKGIWEGGKGVAGVRGGYAATVLSSYPSQPTQITLPIQNTPPLPSLSFYRPLTMALRDLTPVDQPVLRVDSIRPWQAFWETSLTSLYESLRTSTSDTTTIEGPEETRMKISFVEDVVTNVLIDLLQTRLATSRVPALTSNLLLCSAGLILACTSTSLPSAADHATSVVDMLLEKYEGNAGEEESDDVLFAVYLGISALSRCLQPGDEIRGEKILSFCWKGVSRKPSGGLDWSHFAASYGISIVLSSLPSSAATSTIPTTIARLASDCLDPTVATSPNVALGAAMGLASVLESFKDGGVEVTSFVMARVKGWVDVVEGFVEREGGGGDVGEGIAVQMAVWGLAGVVGCGWGGVDVERVEKGVAGVLGVVSSKRGHEPIHPHALSAYTQILHTRLQESELSTQLTDLLTTITSTSTPSTSRIAALLALPPLLGITISTTSSPSSHPTLLRRAIDTLRTITLNSEPKIARVSGWVLGRLVSSATGAGSGGAMFGDGGGGGRKGKDPVGYGRLNVGSSYLRGVFEGVGGASVDVATILLTSLLRAAHPLPPVDWSSHITHITSLPSPTLHSLLFRLASQQASATSSKSLTDYFVSVLSSVDSATVPDWLVDLVVGEEGVGKLLVLGGVGKGGDGEGGVAIAGSKVVEVFGGLVEWCFGGGGEGVQRRFLNTLLPHFITPAGTPTELPTTTTTLRETLLNDILTAYTSLAPTTAPHILRTLTTLITTSQTTTLSLLSSLPRNVYNTLSNSEWTPNALWVVGRMVEVAGIGGAADDGRAEGWKWVGDNLITAYGVADLEGVLVRVVREVVGTGVGREGVMGVLGAVSVLCGGRGDEEGKKLVVRMLDVLLVLCGGGTAGGVRREALEDAWGLGVGGVCSVVWGGICSDQDGVVEIDDSGWKSVEEEVVLILSEVLDGEGEDAIARQIMKRVLRILQCTTCEGGGRRGGRVVVSEGMRGAIVELVMRLRDGEEGGVVREGWVDII